MNSNSLNNPIGQYKPEVLILAPEENPLDANLLSLVSQLLEMGIAFELDENWCVPTQPPKDLSAYKSCIFPESAKGKYDKDLDAYYRGGGFLTFDKYYPTATQISRSGFTGGTAAYLNVAWGRDLYFYSLVSYLYEAGVTLNNPDFRRTLERRPTRQLLDEVRGQFLSTANNHKGPWRGWGDPTWTMFLAAMAAAHVLGDDEWWRAIDLCLSGVCAAADEAFADPFSFQEIPIKGAASNGFEHMAHVLMKRGALNGNKSFIDTGVRLGKYFAKEVYENRGEEITDRHGALLYSESILGVQTLFWLTRLTGKRSYAEMASRFTQITIEKTQRADGLWHHFQNVKTGLKGSCWSRAQLWPLIAMTESLEAIGPQSAEGEEMRKSIHRTFEALARFQDRDWGLWRLVSDDPESRVESTATTGILYCHDRLREMGVLDDQYEAMTERALVGLKRLYYRGGLGASCRGTACGDLNFYRSRPQGYQSHTHLVASLARGR